MDNVIIRLRRIRYRAYLRRNRDLSGRFDREGSTPRCVGLYMRVTPQERDMIRSTAAAAGETITDTVVHAVDYYATRATR